MSHDFKTFASFVRREIKSIGSLTHARCEINRRIEAASPIRNKRSILFDSEIERETHKTPLRFTNTKMFYRSIRTIDVNWWECRSHCSSQLGAALILEHACMCVCAFASPLLHSIAHAAYTLRVHVCAYTLNGVCCDSKQTVGVTWQMCACISRFSSMFHWYAMLSFCVGLEGWNPSRISNKNRDVLCTHFEWQWNERNENHIASRGMQTHTVSWSAASLFTYAAIALYLHTGLTKFECSNSGPNCLFNTKKCELWAWTTLSDWRID